MSAAKNKVATMARCAKHLVSLGLLLVVAFGSTASLAQLQRGGTPATDRVPPVNSAPEPPRYRVVRDWAELTIEQRPWGGTNNVAIDLGHHRRSGPNKRTRIDQSLGNLAVERRTQHAIIDSQRCASQLSPCCQQSRPFAFTLGLMLVDIVGSNEPPAE